MAKRKPVTQLDKIEQRLVLLHKEVDKLARLSADEFHSIYERLTSVERRVTLVEGRLTDQEERLHRKLDVGFASIVRRLDDIVQPQLDQHAHRIKKLETAVFK
ncbi:hypothetical protein A2765_03195 [Candidatus Kaiserbacteria bacterium RIFCSPHIGHO2_01_FULL_56_24]|uniref:Uncharacterized protein n=1 Tax=Candidatus Kaiserbacteria bacterium RIFCSPHIGHO2_01_FULL_56_24 TaxID=1798487 RepID=A0A1F6DA06_9BACT|nr:MAG: hypothetical protein A2765_03195 [Candidatus Kaiserbacteria bacterium RIFCSPHIGHO2_01_FULL_56_24]